MNHHENKILGVLAAAPNGTVKQALSGILKEKYPVSFYRLLDGGYIRKAGLGLYQITDAGRKAVETVRRDRGDLGLTGDAA